MTTTYKAEDIAKFFISRANKEYIDKGLPEGITNLKLQKILYFAQAAHLAINDEPLFEEDFVAWKYGPVIEIIYNKYSGGGASPIQNPETEAALDKDTAAFLERIWEIYGKYSAFELVNISHNHLPWKETYHKEEGAVIPKDVIKSYYQGVFDADE